MYETRWGDTLVRALQADITTSSAQVIVNAANSSLLGGGGVDGAIHRAAGPDLLAACRAVRARQGQCPTGQAVRTEAGNLDADYVVHTVGPVWTGEDPEAHDALLASCYSESLRLGHEAHAATIAFPNISTGVYRFPLERAAHIATAAVQAWLLDHRAAFEQVDFVCFEADNLDLYRQIISPH